MTDRPSTRYGILGFGLHAAKRLVPAFRGASHARLHGLWRRDAAKAAEAARDFDVPLVFETPEELCASPEIDAVFVASPDALHLEHVLLALRHHKPVLCEKPLAMSLGEVGQMLSAATAAGVVLGVAQNMRYNASLARMRRWIGEGRVGTPDTAHAQFSYETARSPRTWIHDPALARGGPIGDVGIHCIDALCFVLDQPASSIRGVTTLAYPEHGAAPLETRAVLSLEFASGALAAVTVSGQAQYRSLVEVTGSAGVVICENAMTVDQPVHLVLREPAGVVADELISNADAFSRMLDSFALSLAGGAPYLAPGAEGLANQRVLDAAYESWREGMRIALKP
ncbi:MAG TPA: Gfo/Idh/MocA family oxidoreductase [Acidobacteriaceae bacterium]